LRLLADDGSAQVRAAAARGLGQFLLLSELGEINPSVGLSVERALWTTIQRSGEELEVRRQALQSIAYSSEAGIVDLIEQTYRHEDPAMRVSAVFAMGRNADAAWRPLVQRELSSADPAMRREAARASGELEDRQAVPALIRLVQDDDSEVRLAAIEALGQIGGSPARRLLEKLLQEGDDDEKSAVEEALEMLYFHSGIDIPLFASWGELADDEDDWLEEDE
ncbi:MAG: HEAT repeat domain-containing protein, partial [Chloroflexi bacterium]|nr:HEAT repeat domain-containing protein [Chloroflexota bacterium]